MRVVINERNKREELLKQELESIKKQIETTNKQNHEAHKSTQVLKQEFQEKEAKF